MMLRLAGANAAVRMLAGLMERRPVARMRRAERKAFLAGAGRWGRSGFRSHADEQRESDDRNLEAAQQQAQCRHGREGPQMRDTF